MARSLHRLTSAGFGQTETSSHSSDSTAADISDWSAHREIAERVEVDYALVERKIRSSEAIALLAADYDLSQKNKVEGSPTFIMNEGRQKLFGNVGYRLISANVQELLHRANDNEMSWC